MNYKLIFKHYGLIKQLSRREIEGKYKGSMLGMSWTLINPLLLLAVYTFIFSYVFAAKWGQKIDSLADFSIILFTGLIVYGVFSETLSRAPTLIIGHVNYVKKVIFPLATLSIVNVIGAVFQFTISVLLLILIVWINNKTLNWQVIFIPVIMAPYILFCLSVSWLFSSLGVYLRDIGHIATLLVTAMMFLSPIFYPLEMIPEGYRYLFYINPLTFIIEQIRDIMIFNMSPNWNGFLIYSFIMLVITLTSYKIFNKLRTGFADVL